MNGAVPKGLEEVAEGPFPLRGGMNAHFPRGEDLNPTRTAASERF